jgi:predicted ATPase
VIQLKALGGLQLEPSSFTQPKPLLLLIHLALEGAQQRRHLAELFWPEGQGLKSLSMTLTRLRQGAGPVVEADDRRVWTTVASDVKALLETLDKSQWRRAAELYTGAFVEGVVLDWGSELEEWVYTTREYLAERVQYALLNLAEAAAMQSDFQTAAGFAERAYRLPGLAGTEVGRLKQLYSLLAAGQSLLAPEVRKEAESYGIALRLSTAEARAAFETTAAIPHNLVLKGTSFVGRDLELTEIATLLAKPSCRLLTLTGSGGSGKTRLALQVAHEQLKLGSYPDGVFMVMLEAIAHAQLLPTQLAQALNLDLAEGEPLSQVKRALGHKRLLLVLDNFEQLLGKAAGRSSDLDRSEVDGAGAAGRVGIAKGKAEDGSSEQLAVMGKAAGQSSDLDRFRIRRSGEGENAREADGAVMLSELLRACPNLKLLITSRERLNLEEEHVFLLEGLPYPKRAAPAWEEAEASDAVQLFVQRAEQAQPSFGLTLETLPDVIRICHLVEGLPLGLELAASWVRYLSCAEIAAEISRNLDFLTSSTRDVPERQRSLRAVFASSWRLLGAKEQEALRKLSVFRGGFRREAAGKVTGATLPLLASLVDKSLLRVLPDGRYDRHPLLYYFIHEKSVAKPAERLRTQCDHAAYYLELAAKAEPLLRSSEQVYWFNRLEEELENFRVAFDYLADDPLRALKLAGELGYFWEVRGHYREGYEVVSRFLDRVQAVDKVTAKALLIAANLARRQGDHQAAQRRYEASLSQAETLAEAPIQIEALNGLGIIAKLNRGDYQSAHRYYQQGLELARRSADKALVAQSLRLLGALAVEHSRYREAQRSYEESARLYTALGDQHSRAKSLVNLATVLTYLGDLDKAHQLNLASLELFRVVGDKHGEGISLLNLGLDAATRGERRESIRLYQESLALFRTLGEQHMVSHLLNNLAGVYQELAELHQARELLAESLAIQRHIGDVSLISHALYILGQVHHDLGESEAAYRCYQECVELCRKNDENWALMRVLEVLAKWHIERQDYSAARAALEQARALAEVAGDHQTLAKVRETQARLEAASSSTVTAAPKRNLSAKVKAETKPSTNSSD